MEMTVYSRVMGVVLLAAGVTIALFLVMKVLVTGQEYKIEEEFSSIGINFVRVERDEESRTKDRALKRPSKVEPEEPPPPPKLLQPNRPNVDKASMSADMGAFDLAGLNLNAPVDGDTLAIVRVLPRYPSRALSRGIEGWVLLEFAVDELGLAVNPVVIESEPPGIFDRAATSAVQRWKYRPMIEDGRPRMRPGVRQLISFEIAE